MSEYGESVGRRSEWVQYDETHRVPVSPAPQPQYTPPVVIPKRIETYTSYDGFKVTAYIAVAIMALVITLNLIYLDWSIYRAASILSQLTGK